MNRNPEVQDRLRAILDRPQTHKRCSRCMKWQPVDSFRPNPKLKGGLHSWCRICCAENNRKWRGVHPEYVAASNADRRKAPQVKACLECGTPFTTVRNRIFCGHSCKQRNYTKRKGDLVTMAKVNPVSPKPPDPTVPPDVRRPQSGSSKVEGFQTAKSFGPKPTGKGQGK